MSNSIIRASDEEMADAIPADTQAELRPGSNGMIEMPDKTEAVTIPCKTLVRLLTMTARAGADGLIVAGVRVEEGDVSVVFTSPAQEGDKDGDIGRATIH